MKSFDYSLVVPVYNSEATLRPLFERTKAFFERIGSSFQMVFVDDGSRDGSWQCILSLKESCPSQVKAIRLIQNCGQQNATLCGIKNSDGRTVITIDDDLQIPPEEIEKLIITWQNSRAELVYGLFDSKRHSLLRNAGSWFFNKLFAFFASTSGKGSSFRLITGDLAGRLAGINQKHLLLDEVLHWFTTNVAHVSVEHRERADGKSGYSFFKLVIISLRYVIYYTVIPLRLMTYIGFLSSLASFIGGMVYIYRWIVLDATPGYTSTILAIFFSASIILFSLGIIGEYISRFYVLEFSRPPYVIKEMH